MKNIQYIINFLYEKVNIKIKAQTYMYFNFVNEDKSSFLSNSQESRIL